MGGSMFLSNWFNTEEVDAFARALAQDLLGRLPPSATVGGKSISPSRLNSTREAVQSRASAFSRRYRMSWYKKAHLANTFKWVLREAGCDTSFVDAWTYDVMLHIAEKKSDK